MATDTSPSTKRWVLSRNPNRFRDVCDDNAAQGDIPVDQPFCSGHQGPPAHKNCECSMRVAPPGLA